MITYLLFSVLLVVVGGQQNSLCPPSNGLVGTCVFDPEKNCLSDAQCSDKGQICCNNGCNSECTDPDLKTILPIVKEGTCPLPPSGELVRCGKLDNCFTDSECNGTQKCCDHPCGKRCLSPVKTKPGTCPAESKCEGFNDECYKDSDCSGSEKCCDTKCGNRCNAVSDPVIPPGQCPPATPMVGICLFDPLKNCLNDKQCAEKGQLCCNEGCGKVCKNPVPVTSPVIKEGTCPTPPNPALVLCAAPITDNCTDDSSCKGDLKCCKHPCGKLCDLVRPKPGNCPRSPVQIDQCLSNSQCDNDRDCPLTQKCCASSCGKSCVDSTANPAPVPVTKPSKPGRCPRRRNIFRFRCWFARDFCDNDFSCRGNLKCCQRRCGKRCSRPERVIRRGNCPTVRRNVRCFQYRDECKSDMECGRYRKCCVAACGKRCVRPRLVKG